MRKTIMAVVAAAAVLVVGGAIGAVAQEDDTTTDDTAAEVELRPGHRHYHGFGGVLLDEMVADGVIDQSTADDITAWLEERRAEARAEREERRAAFEEAWADDVLTLDEAEALGGPFADTEDGPLADAWADGQLTRDEVEEARAELGGRRGHHRGPFGADVEESSTGA